MDNVLEETISLEQQLLQFTLLKLSFTMCDCWTCSNDQGWTEKIEKRVDWMDDMITQLS